MVQISVLANQHGFYLKWLRCSVDFCEKHGFVKEDSNALEAFLAKLRDKGQSAQQQQQASVAISLYNRHCCDIADHGGCKLRKGKLGMVLFLHHLHESHVQKAFRRAVDEAGITKRGTAQTFRHRFASNLLQNNFDIRTIQEMLGHSDVRTTMLYTRTVKSEPIKEARSPLDF